MGRIYKRTCNLCGEYYEGKGKYFCSRSCSTKHRNITNNPAKKTTARLKISASRKGKPTIVGKKHWNWKGKKTKKLYCLDCGKQLKSIPWGKRKPKYCVKCFQKGERSHLWKGGTTPQRQKEYTTDKYKTFIKKVLKRDNYTCQKCGAKNGNGKKINLEVHHIKSYAEYPLLRFETNNAITLCKKCHNETKKGKPRPKRVDKKFSERICENCGEKFSIKNPRKFCPKCKILTCKQCKIKFKVKNSKYTQKFCSIRCRSKWFSNEIRGENNPKWKSKIKKKCIYCNKEYFIKPSLIKTSKFCSKKCKDKYYSKKQKNDYRKA